MFSLLATVLLAPAAPMHSTRTEVSAKAFREPANADLVVVQFEFTDGKTMLTVPGFWDGGEVWKARVRLAPGNWQYLVTTKPNVAGLEGATGSVTVTDTPRSEFDRRGPVKVAPSGTHFVYGDGTPFFWLGDTCWNGPLMSTPADWQHYLTTRQRQRFSVVQFVLTAPWRGAPTDLDTRQAFTRRERIEIEPEFFRRVDEKMDSINARGLLAAPVMLWAAEGGQNPGWGLSTDQAVFVARYIHARYHAHDVAWLLGGDGLYDGPEVVERWSTIGRSVFGDKPENLVTLHPGEMHWPFEKYRAEKWLGFCGYQTGHNETDTTLAWTHSGAPAKNWKATPTKPVLNLEPVFEGRSAGETKPPVMDFAMRRTLWWSLLSTPVAGITTGSQGVWSWQTVPGLPRGYFESGFAPVWHTATDRPGARQLKMMRDFLDTLPWTEFRPAQELLANQPGARIPERFISVSACDKFVLAYIPEGGKIELKPEVIVAGATASWYDPRTGKRTDPQPATVTMTTPDAKDWVLVIGRK
ncbi:MAG: DUF4038 domain-containing protein [Gemmataceae bacterium]|nr:DUF4038 domain-containing protein [Gemmataceae bacterium]